MKMKTMACALIGFGLLSCTKVTQQDALQGTLSPKGATGLLGFTKDNDGNYIIAIRQNNLYDNDELRISKSTSTGELITDHIIVGADSKDNGQTKSGNPGGAGSGRLAYNPQKNEISLFSCFSGGGHQYSMYNILSNENATFGNTLSVQGGGTYSHCFDQRTVYNVETEQFYQLSHGDAYPRAMGMFTANTDNKNNFFWRFIVRPPKGAAGYGGNVTLSRIGDIAVFPNGTVAATVVTPFYDNDFLNSFQGIKVPCYSVRNEDDNINIEIWNASINQKYPKNVILNLIPFKSESIVKDGSIGITPDAINLSGYMNGSALAGAIPKVAISGSKVLIAWLTYKDYDYGHAGTLDRTVFCIYDTTTKSITKKDSINGGKLFHTVSFFNDPTDKNKVKWITPNEKELIYHELNMATFQASGFQAAYTTKIIPLNINGATTVKATPDRSAGQFGPLGWYGSNPEIDYIINADGSMDIEWMDYTNIVTQYGRTFRKIYVTTIDKNGDFKNVINIPVRAVK